MTTPTRERGARPSRPCLLQTIAAEMAAHPTLAAVTIDRRGGKLGWAGDGLAPDPAIGERISEALDESSRGMPGEPCGLLGDHGACQQCRGAGEPLRQHGLALTEGTEAVTFSREPIRPMSQAWQWRPLPLPKLVPRQIPPGGNDADLDEWRSEAIAAGLCGVCGLAAWSTANPAISHTLYGAACLAGAWYAAREAWQKLRERALDVHFLMLAVALGSASIGAWAEGTVLLFLFSTSGALERYAMGRTQREIRSLFRTAPKVATLIAPDGQEREVQVEELQVGQRLQVKPGSQFPVDAEIVKGRSASDESNLTGEAAPVEKTIGDTVLAGTMNLWGAVEVAVLRPVQESSLQKIIRLIRDAQHLKAPSQRFTDKFGTGYTYAVLGLSGVMFLFWWLGLNLPPFVSNEAQRSAFYRAMTLLVVASPCALVLSIPSAVLAAIAWGARRGILFRGGAAVEKLSEVNVVALDKTGTLTTGELQVEAVESIPPGREMEVARLAFSLERLSTHPLARAITRYGKQEGLTVVEFEHYESVTGMGIEAKLAGQRVLLGRREWLTEVFSGGPGGAGLSDLAGASDLGRSEVWVWHGDLLGRIILRDAIRAQSRPVVEALRSLGLHTVVLTGDRRTTARSLQQHLGLEDVRAELKPDQKVEAIREFMTRGQRVAMVGDGVNDAPSLAVAHVGVAMGARGSDAALEQAEVVLMHDRLENFLAAFRLSQHARRIIRQNLTVSLATVAVLVGFAVLGQIPLTIGVLGHEGSTVVVVLNSLRLLFLRSEFPVAPNPVPNRG